MSALRFEPERLASPGGLVSSLLAGDPEARGLFPPGVFEPAQAADPGGRHCKAGLSRAPFHCPDPTARARLDAVLAGEGLVVTTGQQPQVFGGPLYVLYKALTAVRAAADLEQQSGSPCLAVYWVAADDHDWKEVASIGYLDGEERLCRLELTPPLDRAGRSVGPSSLPPEIRDLTRDFLDSLKTHEAGEHWRDILRDNYSPGRTFTEAFIGVASAWLTGLPIAFLDSAHPEVRSASIPFVKSVIEGWQRTDQELRRGTDAVVDLGYRAQLVQASGSIPLFRDGVGGRFRLRGTPGSIEIDPDGSSMEIQDLLVEAETEPDRYSPSAALRPVLESWLLPVKATVLGPGEMAYWSQIGGVFGALDVPMPLIIPRDSWRVIEPRTERLLRKTGVTADDLRDGGAAAATELVERGRPRAVEEALLRLEDRVVGEFDALEKAVAADLPGLRSAVGKSRSQAFSALANLTKTLDSMTRDREATKIRQLRRAAASLYPDGNPQERAVATWVYLARHGDGFHDALRAVAVDPSTQGASSREDGVAGASTGE